MTTITIKNSKNLSSEMLTKLLTSLDLEVIKIEEEEDMPADHLESIQRGLDQLQQGLGKSSSEVRHKAREICSK